MYCDFLIAFCGSIGGEEEKDLPILDFIPEDIDKEKDEQKIVNEESFKTVELTEDNDMSPENLKASVLHTLALDMSGFTNQTLKVLLNRMMTNSTESVLFSNRRQEDGRGDGCEKFAGASCAIGKINFVTDLFKKFFFTIQM